MSKRQHERQLARGRAKRRTDRLERRSKRARWIAMIGVAALVLSVFAAVLMGMLGDDPQPDASDPADAGEQAAGEDATCPEPQDVPEVDAQQYDEPPEVDLEPEATYVATLDTTCGEIVVELDAEGAPTATASFVFLAREGFYDGVAFHRVIEDFMIQGGDPEGTGQGGPGYTFEDELGPAEEQYEQVREELLAELEEAGRLAPEGDTDPEEVPGGYRPGMLAMANSGEDTNGSQFFLTHGDPAILPGPDYTLFGEVVEGMDVVDEIATQPTGQGDQPVEPVRIRSVEIEQR